MFRAMLLDAQAGEIREGGVELVDVWQAAPAAVLWLDCHAEPAASEAQLLEERFGVHPLAISDAQRRRHPPKIEAFGDLTFLLLRGLDADAAAVDAFATQQLALFVGERFLVTRHTDESGSIARLRTRIVDDPDLLRDGPDRAALALCRIVVDRYAPLLLSVEERIDELEDELMTEPGDAHLRELVSIQGNLKKLRRVTVYHVQVFVSLARGGMPAIREELRHEITDVHEHLERARSLADLYAEVSTDLMNGYLSLSAHRLNQVMKILTIVTAVFVPLGFLAGVYGMNFEFMPELQWRYAYFALLAVMACVAFGLLLVFRRMGWLRSS